MGFKNLNLATKQLVAFGIVLSIMAGVNFFSIQKMAAIKGEIDEVTTNWLPRALAIAEINVNIANLRLSQLQHAYAGDKATQIENAGKMIALIDKINENIDAYEHLKTDSEERNLYSGRERTLYAAFDGKWEEYQDLSLIFFQLTSEGENQQAVQLLNGEARRLFDDFTSDLRNLIEVNRGDALAAGHRVENTFRSTRRFTRAWFFATLFLAIVIAAALVRLITIPVKELERAAHHISQGDLEVRSRVSGRDEIGKLAESFNKMTESLARAKARTESQAQKLRAQNKELVRTLRELRETQQQLLLSEKMASLGDLVAGVAHEINGPIGVVNSSVDVSSRCAEKIRALLVAGDATEDQLARPEMVKAFKLLDQNLKTTLAAGQRITTLVKSLKNFARLDEAHYQKADINEGIKSTLTLLRNEFQGKITVKAEYGDLPLLLCYPGALNQVMLSLLKNAAAAIEQNGQIHIKTFSGDKKIYVQISDNGRGIPQEKLEKLFDFGFSGTGGRVKMTSGLTSAYNIIEKHDGDIKVSSEVGKGTKVSITLPAD